MNMNKKRLTIIITVALALTFAAGTAFGMFFKGALSKKGTEEPEQISDSDYSAEYDYTQTVKQYHYDRLAERAELGYDPVGPEDYYYCVKDINSDGIPELVIADDLDDNVISGLYTVCDGKVENVFLQPRHGTYSIFSDGHIEDNYKGIVISMLKGKELEHVYYSPTVHSYSKEYEEPYDALQRDFDRYKTDNGFSTEYMNFNFIPYHFSE